MRLGIYAICPPRAPRSNRSAGQAGGKPAFLPVGIGQPKPSRLALDAHHVGASTERINRISPGLHHFPALLQIGGVVVGVAYLVVIAMRQLALNPVTVIAASVQLGTQQVPKAVAGLAALVAHLAQRLVDGVFTHGPVRILLTREYQRVTAADVLNIPQDGDGLRW